MLQTHLLQRVRTAIDALDLAAPLLATIDQLEQASMNVDERLAEIAQGGGTKINDNAAALHSQLASLPNLTRSLNSRKLFYEVEVLQRRISLALCEGVQAPGHIVRFLEDLDTFAEAYNKYVTHQSGANALPLLQVSRQVKKTVVDLRGFLEYILANAVDGSARGPDEAEFALVLFNVEDLEAFAEKLAALGALYAELCFVLGVSAASHPFRIAKIESGSLLTMLFGNSRVVGLMVSLVEGSVRYLHRNYTTEGKFSAIPKRIESLDAILDFSNRLKDNGVDVSDLEQSLAKSAVSITNSLNTLVAEQPVVEINGKVMSVAEEVQKALLSQSKAPQLEFGSFGAATPQLPPPDSSKGAA